MTQQEWRPEEMIFHSIGDFFTFIGLIVSIGAIGVYAIYKLIKECIYGD